MIKIGSVAAGMALVLAGCGGSGSTAAHPDKTVDVEMRELAYTPGEVAVKAGETIRFRFHNVGTVDHDAFIGDDAAQAKHEDEMQSMGGGGHSMAGADSSVVVKPGKTGELTYTFARRGSLLIGCHEKGHYAAGMKMGVTVAS